MSDSDEVELNEENFPSKSECEERCSEFASITGTDTALAMFYLQDRNWDLQRAVSDYFEENDKPSSSSSLNSATKSTNKGEKRKMEEDDTDGSSCSRATKQRFRLLSWNIDGLDSNNIMNRTIGVCNQIACDKPDVIFLQEVVDKSRSILEEKCPSYQLIASDSNKYYTAMMIRVEDAVIHNQEIKQFYSSTMARNLLTVHATVKGVPLTLMTSHLESQGAHTEERKRQLRICLDDMRDSVQNTNVIFGGDLNLRDKELTAVGGLPKAVVDLWEETGSRPEARFTWDIERNDNLDWDLPNKPRCRFDRLYFRPASSDKSDNIKHISPVYFELVGTQRLKLCKRFPSDHWGILAHFDIG